MDISLLALLLQGIPESIALVTLAFVIAKIPLKWNSIILIGSVLAVFAFVIRQLPIPFGIHIIMTIILLVISLIIHGQKDISLSLISSLSSYIALIILEAICSKFLMPAFGLSPNTIFEKPGIWILIGEPQVLILFSLAFLLNKMYIKKGKKK